MKLFLVTVLVQVALLLVHVHGGENFKFISLRDLASQLRSEKIPGVSSLENSRQARILTTYTNDIKQNTANTVSALGAVQTAVGGTTASVDSLKSAIETNHGAVMTALNQIGSNLGTPGQITDALTNIDANIAAIRGVLIDATITDSLQKLLRDLETLLDSKLTNIETILGPEK